MQTIELAEPAISLACATFPLKVYSFDLVTTTPSYSMGQPAGDLCILVHFKIKLKALIIPPFSFRIELLFNTGEIRRAMYLVQQDLTAVFYI